MSKKFLSALAVICLILFSACSNNAITGVGLPFQTADVENIEAFSYVVPDDAEKKVITEPSDVEYLCKLFNSLELKENDLESLTGASITSFRFNLKSGEHVEVVYIRHGVKSGELKSSGNFDYFTSADIGQVWANLPYEAVFAPESELPS